MSTKRTIQILAGVSCLAVGIWFVVSAVMGRSAQGADIALVVVRWFAGLALIAAGIAFVIAASRYRPDTLAYGGTPSRTYWRNWNETVSQLEAVAEAIRAWTSSGRLRPSAGLQALVAESRSVGDRFRAAAARKRASECQRLARRAGRLRTRLIEAADADARRRGWFVDIDDDGRVDLKWARNYGVDSGD